MHPFQHAIVSEQRQRARRDAAHRQRALRAVRAAERARSGDPMDLMNRKSYAMMDSRYLGLLALDLMETSPVPRPPDGRIPAAGSQPARPTRRARLRLSLGFHLMELGLRLATPDARTPWAPVSERRYGARPRRARRS